MLWRRNDDTARGVASVSIVGGGEPSPSLVQRTLGQLRLRRNNKCAVDHGAVSDSELLLDRTSPGKRIGWAIGALIAAGPLLTIAGAEWLRARVEAETVRLEADHAPRQAAAVRAAEARGLLRGTLTAPAIGPTLDRLAAVLPDEDRLTAAVVDGAGVLSVEIATVDPDRLRAALRGTRMGALREMGQQRGDGVLLVRWQGRLA